MPFKRFISVVPLFGLMTIIGCASRPTMPLHEPAVSSVLDDERLAPLGGPETAGFADVRGVLAPADLRLFHEHIGEVEQCVNARLRNGSVAAAWIAGYFRFESSLPLLRQNLLADRYFYGWEGPDPEKESTYLLDQQYTHYIAYIAAIEAITGRSLTESVALTAAEIESLRSEANIDFAKMDEAPEKVQRGLCARWLLVKLAPTALGGA